MASHLPFFDTSDFQVSKSKSFFWGLSHLILLVPSSFWEEDPSKRCTAAEGRPIFSSSTTVPAAPATFQPSFSTPRRPPPWHRCIREPFCHYWSPFCRQDCGGCWVIHSFYFYSSGFLACSPSPPSHWRGSGPLLQPTALPGITAYPPSGLPAPAPQPLASAGFAPAGGYAAPSPAAPSFSTFAAAPAAPAPALGQARRVGVMMGGPLRGQVLPVDAEGRPIQF